MDIEKTLGYELARIYNEFCYREGLMMDIEKTFTYHAPKGDQGARNEVIREKGKELAGVIGEACPDSREKSLALTAVQEAVMWANAAIAIHEREER